MLTITIIYKRHGKQNRKPRDSSNVMRVHHFLLHHQNGGAQWLCEYPTWNKLYVARLFGLMFVYFEKNIILSYLFSERWCLKAVCVKNNLVQHKRTNRSCTGCHQSCQKWRWIFVIFQRLKQYINSSSMFGSLHILWVSTVLEFESESLVWH